MKRGVRMAAASLCMLAACFGIARADLVGSPKFGPESASASATELGRMRLDGVPDLTFLDPLLRSETSYTTFEGKSFSIQQVNASPSEPPPATEKAMAVVSETGGVLIASAEPSTGAPVHWGPVLEGSEDSSRVGAVSTAVASLGLPKNHDDAEGSDEWVLVLTSATTQEIPGADTSGSTLQTFEGPASASTSFGSTTSFGPAGEAPSGGGLAPAAPEPGSLFLLAFGGAAMASFAIRKRIA